MYYNTLQRFRHLRQTWPQRTQPKEKPKDLYLALAGDARFSQAFESSLGKANVTDVYGISDCVTAAGVFEALVEAEALRQIHAKENIRLEGLLHLDDGDVWVRGRTESDGKVHWRFSGQAEGISLVDLICHVFNLPRLDALATLGNMLDMRFEDIVQLSSESHVAEKGHFQKPYEAIPRWLDMSRLTASENATLVRWAEINGNAGQIIGAIAQYRYGENSFCLPATVGSGTLSIGRYKATAFFLNQHLMDTRPADALVFCQDIRTALVLRKILAQCDPANSGVIITGHLFDDLSVLPWNYLYGHDVVFVPAPDKRCMAQVKGYHAFVTGAHAKSFKVATHILLHSSPGCDLSQVDSADLPDVEAKMMSRAVVLDDVGSPIHLARQIIDSAISYDAFVRWGQDAGIFKRPKENASTAVQAEDQALKIFDLNAVPDSAQPQNISDVTLPMILSSGGIVMLHAAKNAGKSLVALEMIRATVTGKPAFGIFPTDGSPATAYLLDSETPQQVFAERITQYGLNSTVGSRFFPFAKEDQHGAGKESPLLTDAAFRRRVEADTSKRKVELLVLDNLTTLTDPGGIYRQQTPGEILDWAATLVSKGISVLLVHHSLENNGQHLGKAQMRGSREFSIRAHTEIVVIGRDQICAGEKLGTDAVRESAQASGTTLGLHIKYCKRASVLEGHTFWFHLPLSGRVAWNLLAVTGRDGKPIEVQFASTSERAEMPSDDQDIASVDASAADVAADTPHYDSPTDTDDLTDDERNVLDRAHALSKIQTKDVRDLLGCSGTKALGILNALVQKEHVERFGTGRAIAYRPRVV